MYLLLSMLGVLLPLAGFWPWLLEHGLDLGQLWREVAGNHLAAFAWAEVAVTALTVLFLIRAEVRRRIPHRWAPVLGTLLVGPSFGLPLYLYLRERAREQAAQG